MASLKSNGVISEGDTMVRLIGTVLDERPGEYIVVHDQTGTIFAQTEQANLPPVTSQVELLGQPIWDGAAISLQDAMVNALSSGVASNSLAQPKPATLGLLTKAWEVRDLPADKAAWRYPVRLRGVVTVNTKSNHYFFLQDDTAGISVLMPGSVTNLNAGHAVVVEGFSDPGGFSPIVLASNVTDLGSAPLPKPKPETLFQLATGQEGSQWIEVLGVVRSLSYSNGMAQLNLSDLTGMIAVEVPAAHEPTNLLDATVRIRGACGSSSNLKRQFIGFTMWVSALNDVHIEQPGASDPLSLPAQPIASLGQFHPRQTLQHRVNIAGVVSLADADSFFLQDAEDGVRVLAPGNDLKPGDYVIAAGYPGLDRFNFLLRDAVYKVISHRSAPTPTPLDPENWLDPQLHNRWVQVSARFLNHAKIGAQDFLTLQVGDCVFEVNCLVPVPDDIKNLPPGTLLLVNGLYQILADEARVPRSFQLTLATDHDLQVLEKPSWWTAPHAIRLLGGMGVVTGATILWILMLRRKVEEQTASLQQSESKFRTLVEQSLVGVYIVQRGRFVYVNPRMAGFFGYTAEEMMASCPVENIIFSEDVPLVQEQIRRRIDGEMEFTHYFFRGRRRDGSIIHAEVLGSRSEFGGQPALLGMLLDITERKLAQDKVVQQARMLDLASDAIVVCDLEERILYWNQNAQRIYGPSAEAALGGNASALMRVNPGEFEAAKRAVLKDHKWHGEFVHPGPQGKSITMEARWTLVHDPAGKPGSILAINTDITQQKRLESQFLRTQRLESIGVLAGGIAHDLNNVLAPILMSCHLLEMDPYAPEREQLLESILTSAHRAANLVRQILTFARGTDGRRLAVQPRYLLDELRKILSETLPKSIRLHINSPAELWTINADATQLHQVLMNLCINARDAMSAGGELTVSAANVELDEQHAALSPEFKPGPHVVFSVTDSGSGMTPEIRERIFDPFFTTKEVGQGTGLGLSTSLGIVKSHGGFIQLQSEPGRGSCFKVYLPAQTDVQAAAAAESRQNGDAVRRGNNELILVVDDEVSVLTIAAQTLKTSGYRVVTAKDGSEAISHYVRHKEEVSLVLLDMMMPVLDGPATVHALARINSEVKIIAASGLANEGFSSKINSPTVRAFLPKPYTAEIMLQTVHDVLNQ